MVASTIRRLNETRQRRKIKNAQRKIAALHFHLFNVYSAAIARRTELFFQRIILADRVRTARGGVAIGRSGIHESRECDAQCRFFGHSAKLQKVQMDRSELVEMRIFRVLRRLRSSLARVRFAASA